MGNSIVIGQKKFPSKAAAHRHYSEMLSRATPQEPIPYPEAQELRDLLALHPRADQKIGVGIQAFTVDYGANGQNFCFHVIRSDGSQAHFGIDKCLKGDPVFWTRWLGACRSAIALEKSDLKSKMVAERSVNGRVQCAITGQWQLPHELHLDHGYPYTFERIAREFWKSQGEPNDPDLCFRTRTDNTTSEMFRDESGLKEAFLEFHRQKSAGSLRLIDQKLNLSLGPRPAPGNTA